MKALKKALDDARAELHQHYHGGEAELLEHMDQALDGIEEVIANLDQQVVVALDRKDAEWLHRQVGRLTPQEVSKGTFDALSVALLDGESA